MEGSSCKGKNHLPPRFSGFSIGGRYLFRTSLQNSSYVLATIFPIRSNDIKSCFQRTYFQSRLVNIQTWNLDFHFLFYKKTKTPRVFPNVSPYLVNQLIWWTSLGLGFQRHSCPLFEGEWVVETVGQRDSLDSLCWHRQWVVGVSSDQFLSWLFLLRIGF